jgi:hypothetical protein
MGFARLRLTLLLELLRLPALVIWGISVSLVRRL